MNQKKGLVMEIGRRSCIVLTPEGDFLKVPLSGRKVQIGEEISIDARRPFNNLLLKPFLVAASILLLFVAAQIYQGFTPSASAIAYVSLDINPSIELAADDNNAIISAEGLNDAGKKLLNQVNIVGYDLYEGIGLAISAAIKSSYIQPDYENVILTTFTVTGENSTLIEQELIYKSIETPLYNSNLQADVVIEPVESELRTEAKEAGLSSGRYMLYQQGKKKGLSMSVEELKSTSMNNLQKEKKIKIKELVPGKGYKNNASFKSDINNGKAVDKQQINQINKENAIKNKIKVEVTPKQKKEKSDKGPRHNQPGPKGSSPPGQAKKQDPSVEVEKLQDDGQEQNKNKIKKQDNKEKPDKEKYNKKPDKDPKQNNQYGPKCISPNRGDNKYKSSVNNQWIWNDNKKIEINSKDNSSEGNNVRKHEYEQDEVIRIKFLEYLDHNKVRLNYNLQFNRSQ